MKCARARKLFGAFWDDEITQAEREWLESHLAACPPCRTAYDEFARSLELVTALPREEAAPQLVEKVLARARRLMPAPDLLPETRPRWIPVTAAAAAAVLFVAAIAPWTGWLPGRAPGSAVLSAPGQNGEQLAALQPVAMPERTSAQNQLEDTGAPAANEEPVTVAELFDRANDVEFILDPVALRRGRAYPLPPSPSVGDVQVERAVITF